MAYINGQEVLFSPRIGAGLSVDEVREICTDISTNISVQKIIDLCFPVGIVIECDTCPAELVGGTWEQITDTFLLAAGDTYASGTTGGEATHTLTEGEMPSHRHLIYMTHDGTTDYWGPEVVRQQSTMQSSISGYAGGDQPHNNMPPYLAQNTWKRIA